MDELKITKGFMSGVVSRLINRMLYTKFGCDMNIDIHSITASVSNGETRFHLDVYGSIDNRELEELLSGVGI